MVDSNASIEPFMNFAFRVDASLQIGIGHVMRCLTLADSLKEGGANCLFICRDHTGNLSDMICRRGFQVILLTTSTGLPEAGIGTSEDTLPRHSGWLGVDWTVDATQTLEAIQAEYIDWLVVDHYALDARWEGALRPACNRLMVIDDLADRFHDCDLLLDQNLGRELFDYMALVPKSCVVLVGPLYALLRPDFAGLRNYSLLRRANQPLQSIMIAMGGVDQSNATGAVLEALQDADLPAGCKISVVMGPYAPWLEEVRVLALNMPVPTSVLVNVRDMAALMADTDLAIGAAGSTSWERCCLGLPTLMLVLAENQRQAAGFLVATGGVILIELGLGFKESIKCYLNDIKNDSSILISMAEKANGIADGQGCQRTVTKLFDW